MIINKVHFRCRVIPMKLPLGLLRLILCGFTMAVLTSPAAASIVGYTFLITTAISGSLGPIGGPTSPISLSVAVDLASGFPGNSVWETVYPLLSSDAADGPFFAVDGMSTKLDYGSILLHDSGVDVFNLNAYANGGMLGANGRSLVHIYLGFWSYTGQLFSIGELPLQSDIDEQMGGALIKMFFEPNATDPEYQSGEYIDYSAFLTPADLKVTVRQVPEPDAVALLGAALLAFFGVRRKSLRDFVNQASRPRRRG